MAAGEKYFTIINGINIRYNRTGGDKPPLVMLHGLTACGACWTEVARLLEKDYDIIMPDARGHGESDAPHDGYSYKDYADDVLGLINSLKLNSPVLLGHSMGGMTALLTSTMSPGSAGAIVLADPPFLSAGMQREIYDSYLSDHRHHVLDVTHEDLVSDLQRRHPSRSPEITGIIAAARRKTSLAAFEVLAPPNPDYRSLISSVDIPGLLVYGERGIITPAVAEEIHKLNQRFRFEQMPGTGHGLHYDQPRRFADIVGQFLRFIG